MADYRVNVYLFDGSEEVVGRVRYNSNLDYWDGRNFCNPGMGYHRGLTKLKDGRYVLIEGSDYQGERDYGYIISPSEALQQILQSNNTELLNLKKFVDLKKLYIESIEDEEDLEEC